MSALGFAAIAALTSAVGQGIGSVVNSNKDFKTNKKLMDYQNEINNANWEKQNARQDYLLENNAKIQKDSYKNAGLNPALLSEGNFTGNVASSMPRLADVGLSNNFANSAQSKTASIQSAVSIANAIAQTKVANAQARNLNADAELKETDAGTRSDINQATLDNLKSQNVINDEQARYIASNTANNEIDYDYALQSFNDRLDSIKKQNDVTYQTFLKLQEDTKLLNQTNEWYPRLMQSEINLKASQVRLNDANRKEALANVDKINFYLNELAPQERKETIQRIENLCQIHDLGELEVERKAYETEVYKTVDPKVRAIMDLTFDALDRVGGFIGHTAGAVSGLKNAVTNRNNSNRTTTTTTNIYDKNGNYSGGSRSTQRKR